MRLGIDKYRIMQAKLDVLGIVTNIVRNGSRSYQFIVNMKPVKQYTTRGNCNKYLAKLYRENIRTCWDILGIKETKKVKAITAAFISRCDQLAKKSGDNTIAFCELCNARQEAHQYATGLMTTKS